MQIQTIVALCTSLTIVAACGDSGAGDGYTSANDDASDADTDESGTEGTGDTGDTTGDTSDTDGIPIDPDNMIDNFEDGDNALIPNGGRQEIGRAPV